MKKSVFCIAAALLLSLSLVSCTGNQNGGSSDSTADSTSAVTEGQSSEQSSEQASESNTEKDSEEPTDANTENMTSEATENTTDGSEEIPDDRIFVRSDTGTGLNLVVGYTVEKNGDGSYTVNADVGLESYSLSVTARQNNNYLQIGDETYYFSTDAIDYKGEALTVFDLGSHSFTIPADTDSVPLYAVWYFNGVYSEKPMTAIMLEAEITLE